MNVFAAFETHVRDAVLALAAGGLFTTPPNLARVVVEQPRDAGHGDLTTNAAMVLARDAGLTPRDLAGKIADNLAALPTLRKVAVAGAGFINIDIVPSLWATVLAEVLRAGSAYGRSTIGRGEEVTVESMTADPTGPIQIGHGRNAVVGDALASLLAVAGYDVTREHCIDHAGPQVDVLARSAYLRYRQALGEAVSIPAGHYPGDYLKSVGATLAREHGPSLADMAEERWLPIVRDTAIAAMTTLIRADLQLLNVRHDVVQARKTAIIGKRVLKVARCQPVKVLRNGEPVKMSKGSGDVVSLRDVVEEVGADAVRFIMLTRKCDAPLDFDLAKVVEQSKDNPVFQVQYAHARCRGIFRGAHEAAAGLVAPDWLIGANLAVLTDKGDLGLLKRLAQYPRLVEQAAAAHEPHRVALYLHDLANEFHEQWNRGKDMPHLRFIRDASGSLTRARLALVRGVETVLSSGLALLGVSAPDEMR